MTVQESLQLERNKKSNEIVLIKEGSWWRAYEESAYICRNFSTELKEDERLKPTHRHFKDINEDLIFVGFPVKSISKYLPNIENGMFYSDDMDIATIDISDYTLFNSDIKDEYIKWKNSVPFKTKEKSNINNNPQKSENKESDKYMKLIMFAQEILAYPLENKTMIENISFISELKRKFISII